MKRLAADDIVLKVLGLLLLTAAALNGHGLLIVPVANDDLGSWRSLLIFQMESELALRIWLLSDVFKPSAWLAALLCSALFCCIALIKVAPYGAVLLRKDADLVATTDAGVPCEILSNMLRGRPASAQSGMLARLPEPDMLAAMSARHPWYDWLSGSYPMLQERRCK
jgi:hypothetical protein